MSERRKRVLVIDDEPMICELLQWILRASYEVQTEDDSIKGLEAAQTSPPDLLLCDLTMPRLSGPALIAQLMADPRTTRVPVLLVSGDVSVHPGSTAWKHVAGVLQKPFSPDELLLSVASVLASQAAEGTCALSAA